MKLKIANIGETKTQLSTLVRLVESGTHVIIQRCRRPVALLTRIPPELLLIPEEEIEVLFDVKDLIFDEESMDGIAVQFATALQKWTKERRKSHAKQGNIKATAVR